MFFARNLANTATPPIYEPSFAMEHKKPLKALLVEDDYELAETICLSLTQWGWSARHAPDAEYAVQRCLREETYHLVICDLMLPGETGLSLLLKLRDMCPATHTVLLTGQSSTSSVATAFKRGAVEFIPKPVKLRDLRRLCDRVKAEAPLYLPNRLLGEQRDFVEFEGLLSREGAMLAVFDHIRDAAALNHSVLLVGEVGVGKTSLAQALHRRSPRQAGPFIPLRTAAYPTKRLPRALFGRERDAKELSVLGSDAEAIIAGAVERAETGTLYIDDVTAFDTHLQAQLLILLETATYRRVRGSAERRANVRVVVGTPRELEALVTAKVFNPDLYHRLSGCVIQVPPLRERRQDIPLIASHILQQLVARGQSRPSRVSSAAEKVLVSYPWPGNVRELESTIQLSVFGVRSASLMPYQLPPAIRGAVQWPGQITIPVGTKLQDIEREVILQTLRLSNGNKSHTADMLGISRRSLYDKLIQYQKILGIDLLEVKDKNNLFDPDS